MSLRTRPSQPKELFAAVMYLHPYHNYPKDVVSVSIIKWVVGEKVPGCKGRPTIAFRPTSTISFTPGQVYRLVTDTDAADHRKHPYNVYIGRMSESQEELRGLLSDKSKVSLFNWPSEPEIMSEPETSDSESDNLANRRRIESASGTAKANKNARHANHMSNLDRLTAAGHIDLHSPNLQQHEVDAWQIVRELREEIKRKDEERKREDEETKRKDEESKRIVEEARRKTEELQKKEEQIDHLLASIENLRRDVSFVKEDMTFVKESISKYAGNRKSYVMEWVRNLPVM